jgi:hypothetical protein
MRQTDSQRAAIAAAHEKQTNQSHRELLWYAEQARARQQLHWEQIGDLVLMLRQTGVAFYRSLSDQLEHGGLSPKQARHVARATSATGRQNRFNAAAWDDVVQRCTEGLPGLPLYNPKNDDKDNSKCEN